MPDQHGGRGNRQRAGRPAAGRGSGRGAGRGGCGGGRRYGRGPGRGALVEPAALAVLLRRNGHGYDIRKEIAEETDGEIDVDVGGLYRVLRRLEEEGFVVSSLEESDAGPQRREYRLTGEGRELAEDWVCHLEERRRLAGILLDALNGTLRPGERSTDYGETSAPETNDE